MSYVRVNSGKHGRIHQSHLRGGQMGGDQKGGGGGTTQFQHPSSLSRRIDPEAFKKGRSGDNLIKLFWKTRFILNNKFFRYWKWAKKSFSTKWAYSSSVLWVNTVTTEFCPCWDDTCATFSTVWTICTNTWNFLIRECARPVSFAKTKRNTVSLCIIAANGVDSSITQWDKSGR